MHGIEISRYPQYISWTGRNAELQHASGERYGNWTWLKAVVRKEFVDDNRVKVNSDGNFVNDLSGRRGIYQAGIKASFSSTLSGHLGVGYSRGAGVESPWNAVAGVNWSFWPSTIKLRFGAVFVYRVLKGKILGQKSPSVTAGNLILWENNE